MSMTPAASRSTLFMRLPSWLILVGGVAFALLVSVLAMEWLLSPGRDMLWAMTQELTTFSAISLGAGFLLYRLVWRRSPSLILTLAITYTWAALLTIFNVWIMARLMFVTQSDLQMATVFLLFGSIIATFFAVTVMSRVTRGLRELALSAQQVAGGDYSVRVDVPGRDEVSALAGSFNVMAEQLAQAERQREELEKLRRDLVAWTSHDLRTPLTSIRAMIEALHDGIVTDQETVRRYHATIRSDIIGLNTLIDDLFELAQLDTGGLRMEQAHHLLSDLVSDALERFQALAAERGVALSGRVDSGVDPVHMDAARIERVVNNLLSNALSYAPAGGQVTIHARRADGQAEVTVRDNGPGFVEADLPRVFEKFYRGEQARSRSHGNAGLGLAIAQGIVEAHGGEIWAENGADGGAVVTFRLPPALR